jgi:choline dehydrogenase-like flavoprotein
MWILGSGFGPPISTALGESHFPAMTTIPPALRDDRVATRAIRWGSGHHEAFQEQLRRTIALSVYVDELPDEANRVELDPTIADEVGIPGVKLFFKRSENTKKMFAFGTERLKEIMASAGATNTSSELLTAAPGHYLGTARMGDDPSRSVVDKWGRAHDVKNLFVIDGSVFTTAGAVAPTSTIHAIALRTADYIKTNARSLLT